MPPIEVITAENIHTHSLVEDLNAPKSRDSLRLRRRFWPLPEKSRDFLRPQEASDFLCEEKSLANRDLFFADENE